MNPISLTLKNFRSYKNETISFEHDGVMPIVGKNGHGKSSAFYGILLALYGKVPIDNVEVPVKELVSDDGSKDMSVTYRFSHSGKEYRIERVYRVKKTKAGVEKCDQVKCEFFQVVGEDEIQLSSKAKAETGQKIVSVIGKDCDNFCNSAFFPQSEENRLARLKPSELIEEIAKLKGITVWEALREKAKKALDLVKADLVGIETYAEEAKVEIATLPEVQDRITSLEETIKSARAEIEVQEKKLASLLEEKNQVSALVQATQEIRQNLIAIEGDIKREQESVSIFQTQVSNAKSIIARKAEIESQRAELEGAEKEKALLDKNARERTTVLEKIQELEAEINGAEQAIKVQFQELSTRYNGAAQTVLAGETGRQQLQEAQTALEAAMAAEQAILAKREENQTIGAEITRLSLRNQQLLANINEETGKVNNLLQSGICGECERPIDEHGAEQIKQHKSAKIQEWTSEGNANEQSMNTLNAQIAQNNEFITSQEEKAALKGQTQTLIGKLEAGIAEAERADQERAQLEPECARLQSIIQSGQFSDKVPELEASKAKLGELYYDSEHHEEVTRKVAELKDYSTLAQQLADAEGGLPAIVRQLESVESGIAEKQQRAESLRAQLANTNLIELESKVQTLESDIESLGLEAKGNKRELDDKLQSLGAEQKQEERIKEKKAMLEEKLSDSDDLRHKQYLYERAIEMYSKSGIPTLIIESLIPDIEAEANLLLRQMSSEKAVSFERPKRADGTLQDKIVIMVRDRRGVKRTFNTFSGAECFQISFALRVAICGSDDIMFIDEGFGKLDPENLSMIVSTLSSLREKFRKIVIITHLKELIDMFDVRLAISLDSKGYSKAKWVSV